jgi:hypothetical protein
VVLGNLTKIYESRTSEILWLEIEPNSSKDIAMHERDNPIINSGIFLTNVNLSNQGTKNTSLCVAVVNKY